MKPIRIMRLMTIVKTFQNEINEQWQILKKFFEEHIEVRRGCPGREPREVMNGILWPLQVFPTKPTPAVVWCLS